MKAITSAEFAAQDTNPSDRSLPQDLRFSQNQVWENWGRTAHCQPEFSFYPQRVEDLAQIVHFARERGRQVSGYLRLPCGEICGLPGVGREVV